MTCPFDPSIAIWRGGAEYDTVPTMQGAARPLARLPATVLLQVLFA